MKYILFIFLLSSLAQAQVGIKTTNPTEALDINGTMRIRDLSINEGTSYLLSSNENNEVNKVSKTAYASAVENHLITIQPGKSGNVINTNSYEQASIVVSSSNLCHKQMISSFVSYGDAISFINGVAREKIANPTIQSVTGNDYTNFAPIWIIKFDNVTNCTPNGTPSGSGGTGTQFNFTLTKTNDFTYQITNNGDVERTYDISFLKLY